MSISTQALLIELQTEELPPKALSKLATAFSETLLQQLKQHNYAPVEAQVESFATPRRLAARINTVYASQPDSTVRRRGPAVASALNAEGQPTPALLGFLKSCQASLEQLTQEEQQGHRYFFFEAAQKGEALESQLGQLLEQTIKKLPIPKTMRWGNHDESFVRPVKSVLALHGNTILPIKLLGHNSDRLTQGHRILSKQSPITIAAADTYEETLKSEGYVIADYATRRAYIVSALQHAQGENEQIVMPDALIDEVCGLVEYPVILRGHFDAEFLSIPKEVLILSMQTHQRYFAIEDQAGNLTPSFLLVSNILTDDPTAIIEGNQRVLRARLSDARFFFEQDKKTTLLDRTKQLEHVIYHQKLGSQAERLTRLKQVGAKLYAPLCQAWSLNPELLNQTIMLSKADLVSDMVGEFPELQGVIGSYYAEHEGYHTSVVAAIREQYQLKFDTLSLYTDHRERSLLSVMLRVTDRLEALVGLYGVGLIPTGDKDPFALRRCAFVILDALEWFCQESLAGRLPTSSLPCLKAWIDDAWSVFPQGQLNTPKEQLLEFIYERMRQRLTQHFPKHLIDAVLNSSGALIEAPLRVAALSKRTEHPAVQALAQAHKRVQNLLKKADASSLNHVDPALFQEEAERILWSTIQTHQPICEQHLATLNIDAAIDALAHLAAPVEQFFNSVMVMVEDPTIRNNRLALLSALNQLILSIAQLAALS